MAEGALSALANGMRQLNQYHENPMMAQRIASATQQARGPAFNYADHVQIDTFTKSWVDQTYQAAIAQMKQYRDLVMQHPTGATMAKLRILYND